MPDSDSLKALSVLAVLVFFFILERFLTPYGSVKRINKRQRLWHNGGLALLTAILSRWWVLPVSLLAYNLSSNPLLLEGWLPGWGVFAAHLLVLDLWLYWWHRLNHEWPVLWRFHAVHHRDDALDVTTAFRFHVGEVFLSALPRGVIIFALGIPISHVLVYEALVAVHSAFHHANIALPAKLERLVRPLFISPTMHWVHHNPRVADTNSNYGATLTIWDILFKSYNRKQAPRTQPMGIEGMIKKQPDFKGLLFQPFKNQAKLYQNNKPPGT